VFLSHICTGIARIDLLLLTSTLLAVWPVIVLRLTQYCIEPVQSLHCYWPLMDCPDRPLTGAALQVFCREKSIVIACELSLTHFCTDRHLQTFCSAFAAGQPLYCSIAAQRLHQSTALILLFLLHSIHDTHAVLCWQQSPHCSTLLSPVEAPMPAAGVQQSSQQLERTRTMDNRFCRWAKRFSEKELHDGVVGGH